MKSREAAMTRKVDKGDEIHHQKQYSHARARWDDMESSRY